MGASDYYGSQDGRVVGCTGGVLVDVGSERRSVRMDKVPVGYTFESGLSVCEPKVVIHKPLSGVSLDLLT